MVGDVAWETSDEVPEHSYSARGKGHKPSLSQDSNTLSQVSCYTELSSPDIPENSKPFNRSDDSSETVVYIHPVISSDTVLDEASKAESPDIIAREESDRQDSAAYEINGVSDVVLDISSLIPQDGEEKVSATDHPKEVSVPNEPLKTLIALLILGIGFLSTSISLSITHDRVPSSDPLPDIILDNVPMQPWGLCASEILLQVSTVTAILVVLLHAHRLVILRRIWLIQGLLYSYRAVTMFITVLPKPDPDYVCVPQQKQLTVLAVVNRSWEILSGMGLTMNGHHVYCGDYIFSGHTMTLVLGCLVVLEYSPGAGAWRLLHLCSLATSLLGVLLLLLGRGHYSLDVLLAYYVTTRLWWTYHTLADNQQLKRTTKLNKLSNLVWWRVFRYFEQNITEPLPRRYNLPFLNSIKKFVRTKRSLD